MKLLLVKISFGLFGWRCFFRYCLVEFLFEIWLLKLSFRYRYLGMMLVSNSFGTGFGTGFVTTPTSFASTEILQKYKMWKKSNPMAISKWNR